MVSRSLVVKLLVPETLLVKSPPRKFLMVLWSLVVTDLMEDDVCIQEHEDHDTVSNDPN